MGCNHLTNNGYAAGRINFEEFVIQIGIPHFFVRIIVA